MGSPSEVVGGVPRVMSGDTLMAIGEKQQLIPSSQQQPPPSSPVAIVGNDWVSGVEKVFQFFERRTPGSYTERTTGTLTWYWDDTIPDLGKQQVIGYASICWMLFVSVVCAPMRVVELVLHVFSLAIYWSIYGLDHYQVHRIRILRL